MPLPELTALRTDIASQHSGLELAAGQRWSLNGVAGVHLDIELRARPFANNDDDGSGDGSTQLVILLQSWRAGSRGAAAIVYDWSTCKLEVVFDAVAKRGWLKAANKQAVSQAPNMQRIQSPAFSHNMCLDFQCSCSTGCWVPRHSQLHTMRFHAVLAQAHCHVRG